MKCLADQNLNRAIKLQTMFTLTQLPKSSLFKPILENRWHHVCKNVKGSCFFSLHLFDESSLTRPAFLPCKRQNWLTMPVSFIITARQLVTATNTSVLISYRTYNFICQGGLSYLPIIEYILLYCLKKKKTSLTHHDPIVTANIVLDLKDTPIH